MSQPALLSALLLGLTAGVAPGPLLTLLIGETLRHGHGAGVRVALSPLITDLPIIGLALLLAQGLAGAQAFLGGISIAGSLFLFFLAFDLLRGAGTPTEAETGRAEGSLLRGVLTNLLNPHPYLFWIGVGVPLLVKSMEQSGATGALLFIFLFYLAMVGTKVGLALLLHRGRGLLSGPVYRLLLRLLGLLMGGLGLALLDDGISRLS